MRRLLILLVVPGLLLAAGCGATAEQDAARVGERPVTTASVDALAHDAAFVKAVLGASRPPGESTVPGDVARSTLLFEVQRAALRNEVARWGLRVTDADRQAAGTQLVELLAGAGSGGAAVADLDAATRRTLTDFLANGSVLDRRLAGVSPQRSADLDLLYEGSPALWDRVCMTVVQVPTGAEKVATRLAGRGVRLEQWPRTDPRLQVVADAATGCVQRARLPRALRDAVAGSPGRRVEGPVLVRSDQGSATFWFRIDRRTRVSRAAAGKDLADLAAGVAQQGSNAWVGLRLLSDVWINPRYGSGMEVGSTGRVEVGRPVAPVPVLQRPTGVPAGAPGGAAPAAAG